MYEIKHESTDIDLIFEFFMEGALQQECWFSRVPPSK